MMGKLIGNSLSSILVPLVKMGITFIMAPLIVRALGNYDYGVWEIAFSVIGYMGILDLGLMPAIVRYVARYHALDDHDELHRIFSTALAFFFPVGFIMAVILISLVIWAPDLFIKSSSATVHTKYSFFFLIISVQLFFTFVGGVFDCFLEGLQRYSLRNYSTIIFSLAGAMVMYPLLKNGGGLLTVALGNSLGYSLKYLLYGILLRRTSEGGYRFQKRDVSRSTFRNLFDFGFKSFVYAVSLRISTLTDPLVIGAFIGAATVPLYVIPVNLVGQIRNLVWSTTRNFMPVFSELDALSEKDRARDLLFDSSRFALGIIAPIMTGICVLGPSFLSHWMGEEYAVKGQMVLYLIAAAYMVQWLNPFSNRFFTGVGKHGILARLGMIGSVLNLVLSIIFVQFLGKEGVALGTLIPVVLFEPYLLYKTCRLLETSITTYLKYVLLPLVIPTLSLVIALVVSMTFLPAHNLLDVAMIAAFGMCIYVPVFVLMAISRDERNIAIQAIKRKIYTRTAL